MTTKTVREAEAEAEAIAFIVTKAIGLDSGNASSDYIQLYRGNAKLLQESLEVVQQTSAVILGAISPSRGPQRGVLIGDLGARNCCRGGSTYRTLGLIGHEVNATNSQRC